MAEFRNHKGIRIFFGNTYVDLMPSTVVDINAVGIIIGCSSGGYYEYKGDKVLNKFILVQRGFPLHLSVYICNIINTIVTYYGMGQVPRETRHRPLLCVFTETRETKEKET